MKKFFKPAIAIAVLLAVAPSTFAQQPPGPEVQPGSETPRGDVMRRQQPITPEVQPGTETPRGDVTRTAPGAIPATGIKPPIGSQRGQSGGDGTQTEDELYVGRKRTSTPLDTAPATLPGGAPTVGNKPPPSISGQGGIPVPPRRTGRASGDDDDIDDQEVQRRTVKGVEKPGMSNESARPALKRPVGRADPNAPAMLPAKAPVDIARTAPPAARPPTDKKNAIIIPRENCGTFWTQWAKDPKADSNPCPANCERGERLDAREQKTDSGMQYQANYRCILPELVVNPPPAAAREPGAPPRSNCGTFWTKRQSDPNADVNPCPANCERGELLDVRRGRSGDKLHYEMNYRCYAKRTSELTAKKVAVTNLKLIGAGPSAAVTVTQLTLVAAGPTPTVTVAELTLTGAGPMANVSVSSMSLVGSGPIASVSVPAMALIGSERLPGAAISVEKGAPGR